MQQKKNTFQIKLFITIINHMSIFEFDSIKKYSCEHERYDDVLMICYEKIKSHKNSKRKRCMDCSCYFFF